MKQFFLMCMTVFFLASHGAYAREMDVHAFGQIPVQQDGRIKPLDSLARVELRRISGGTQIDGQSASEWLASVFFEPAEAMKARIFTLGAQAGLMLGLEAHADHRYSFEELANILAAHKDFIDSLGRKDKSGLSREEAEVVRALNATNDFAELMGTFSLLLPLSHMEEARDRLHLAPDAPLTFFDIDKHRQELTGMLKGKPPENAQDRELAQIIARLSLQEALDKDNMLVRIIPPIWGGEEWLSPWGVEKTSNGAPQNALLFRTWRKAALAYRMHDAIAWQTATQELLDLSHSMLPGALAWRAGLEYNYNRLGLLFSAAIFYALGLVAIAFSLRYLRLLHAGKTALLLGLLLHGTALIMRMLILMRPPVSTLYESLIFVSFVVMAASNYLGWPRQNIAALMAGGATALGLLLASWVFAGDSDTLGVLVAVLNTNFWLATHVVCITTGYAGALVTGAIAHLYLFRRAVLKTPEEQAVPLARLLHHSALIALLFTSVGTMLGGIWADQSWGRFWGWDPKENGALLIVLWLIWLLHGRIAQQLSPFSFAAWMALINIVVALAWIGVNLLSVGLHSYGFTDAAATGLIAFCAGEIIYVITMVATQLLRNSRIIPPISAGYNGRYSR